MAKIIYSVSGEGHGHATRSKAIIEELSKKHTVIGLGSYKSVDILKSCCVETHEIPGFTLERMKSKISYLKTGYKNAKTLVGEQFDIWGIRKIIKDAEPDLIITDFEPFVSRVAPSKIPIISIDNQRLITYGQIPVLSTKISDFVVAKSLVNLYYTNISASIITYFGNPKLKKTKKPVSLIPPILRSEVLTAKPKSGDYIVVYVRSEESAGILDYLEKLPQYRFEVFGIAQKSKKRHIKSHGVFSNDFLSYVVDAKAVVCTAGLSLISESLFLQKPLFVVPEKKDFEQFYNAYSLRQQNLGTYAYLSDMTEQTIASFLQNLDTFATLTVPKDGARKAAKLVDAFLKSSLKK